ncbi:MAG: ABC transporter ATP-binding protein [Mycobacteriales bacterium]
MSDPVVLEGLTKRFTADVVAVEDLSLRVGPGEVFGLLGPNGAGKTTTLRMIVGLVRPSAGRAFLLGEQVVPGAAVLARVGVLVENAAFVPHLSGLVNLQMYWKAGGRPLEEAGLERALAVADLGSAINRRVKTYSQGMRQRLGLAQALLGHPALVILDEPTNGLDPAQMREVREAIARLAEEGVTVLLSSHLLAEVEQVCTHAGVMDRGRLVANGTVSALIGAATSVFIEVDDQTAAKGALAAMPGVSRVDEEPNGMLVTAAGVPIPELVRRLVQADVGVLQVVSRRRLEDAFLELLSGAQQ